MLKAQQRGIPACFTVTHLDGIVFSRAAFNHNVNFRSVMAFGNAEFCSDEVKQEVLQVFVDRLAPGLWQYARKPSEQEWKATKVIRMKLDEVSAKVSDGLPDEEPEDYASDRWAGSIKFQMVQQSPVPDPKLDKAIETPDFVKKFRYVR
jgi:nitroimidazol reductase NimA-like FMN-containing flavoprotein (pyridoxamine 5'-phosphate oxidase superfamily)